MENESSNQRDEVLSEIEEIGDFKELIEEDIITKNSAPTQWHQFSETNFSIYIRTSTSL